MPPLLQAAIIAAARYVYRRVLRHPWHERCYQYFGCAGGAQAETFDGHVLQWILANFAVLALLDTSHFQGSQSRCAP